LRRVTFCYQSVDRAHQVEVLRHHLSPFLDEAFGGSTGLVDVWPNDHTRDHPVCSN
jgi:hypothetical protein